MFPFELSRRIYHKICKECKAVSLRVRRKENPEQYRSYYRRDNIKRNGIKFNGDINQWYEEQLKRQNNKCAVVGCDRTPDTVPHKRLFIDHNHKTGKLRGLVCYSCNAGIAVVEDKLESLQQYLAEYD